MTSRPISCTVAPGEIFYSNRAAGLPLGLDREVHVKGALWERSRIHISRNVDLVQKYRQIDNQSQRRGKSIRFTIPLLETTPPGSTIFHVELVVSSHKRDLVFGFCFIPAISIPFLKLWCEGEWPRASPGRLDFIRLFKRHRPPNPFSLPHTSSIAN